MAEPMMPLPDRWHLTTSDSKYSLRKSAMLIE
jgi:hypothetical protein